MPPTPRGRKPNKTPNPYPANPTVHEFVRFMLGPDRPRDLGTLADTLYHDLEFWRTMSELVVYAQESDEDAA